MNYSLMQDRLLKMQSEEHPIIAYHHKGDPVTTYFPWDDVGHTWGYTIPNKISKIDLTKCRVLMELPFDPCLVDEMQEIIPMVEVTNGKRKLIMFETRFGRPTYVAKRLRQRFPIQARFFQDEHLGVITVAVEQFTKYDSELIPIGFVCPHRAPHQNEDSQ